MRNLSRRWWISLALWSAFTILSGWIGVRLLDACAFGATDWPAVVRRFMPNRCFTKAPDLQAVNDGAKALQAAIWQKQLVLAAKIAQCEKTCPPAPQQRAQTEGDIARDVARKRGANAGKLQITLAWHTNDDLDLQLSCPDGWLGQRLPVSRQNWGQCGDGKIDLDANKKMITSVTNPVENAVWVQDIPQGFYSVGADAFMIKSESPVEYLITVKLDDEEKTCTGMIEKNTSEVLLRFRPEHPLPDCDRKVSTHIACDHCAKN